MNDAPRPDLFETMDVRRAAVTRPWWRRRQSWALAGACALIALAVWAWHLTTPGVAQVARSYVWLGTVSRGPFVVQVQAAGTLVPAESRWVAAPVDATTAMTHANPRLTHRQGAASAMGYGSRSTPGGSPHRRSVAQISVGSNRCSSSSIVTNPISQWRAFGLLSRRKKHLKRSVTLFPNGMRRAMLRSV